MNHDLNSGIALSTALQKNIRRRLTAGMFLAGLTLSWGTAYAGTYDALCGGSKCSVVVTPDSIRSPFGEIPASRVTYWGSAGDSKTSVGTGVATTLLFGGIGLLGFLAKNHDYQFTISGYDAAGKKVLMQVQFKNDKPAKRLTQELFAVTGLGMNQTRTLEEIKEAEAQLASTEADALGPMPGRASKPQLGPLASTKAQPVSRDCWSTYLNSNPAMKKWSEANPAMAEQNKKRFDDC